MKPSMPELLLNPSSLVFLSGALMMALVLAYLVSRGRVAIQSPSHRWLLGYLIFSAGHQLANFFSRALAQEWSVGFIIAGPALVSLGCVCLSGFAYSYPSLPAGWRRERMVALAVCGVVAAVYIVISIWRWRLLLVGRTVEWLPTWANWPLPILFGWIFAVFCRQCARQEQPGGGGSPWRRLFLNRAPRARAPRAFAVFILGPILLGILAGWAGVFAAYGGTKDWIMALSTLVFLPLFLLAYLRALPELTSLSFKLSLATLSILLTCLNYQAWVAGGEHLRMLHGYSQADVGQRYPFVQPHQSYRFEPNAVGGLDVAWAPYEFDWELGEYAGEGVEITRLELPFSFPFLGGNWRECWARAEGVVWFDRMVKLQNFRAGYGMVPAIFAGFGNIDPSKLNEGRGMFFKTATTQVTVTWMTVDRRGWETLGRSIQLVLHASGEFQLNVGEAPSRPARFSDVAPDSLWLVGAVSGRPGLRPAQAPIGTDRWGGRISSGPGGVVHDIHIAVRREMHSLARPLSVFIVGCVLLAMVLFPRFYGDIVVLPVNALVSTVRAVNSGNKTVLAPVFAQDEIGFLSDNFNQMVQSLRRSSKELEASRRHLEDEVRLRTADLEVARDAAIGANRAKSLFLANISHELRTPLNSVIGFSNILALSPNLTAEQKDYARLVLAGGRQLLGLINDVLEITKIEAGKTEVRNVPCALGSLLAEAVAKFEEVAQERGLRLSLEKSDLLPELIQTDEQKLSQVLTNLLSNALKFTRKGGVTLRVGIDRQAGPGVGEDQIKLLFEVEDSGLGIAKEELPMLFNPFTQTKAGRESLQGTGLGLAICKQFVRLLGGSIEVDSVEGQGTRFRFSILATRLDARLDEPRPAAAPRVELAPGQCPPRVLIAEDDAPSRRLLNQIMIGLGFETCSAVDGRTAVDTALTWRPGLILMDIRMPGMDGLEATRILREEHGLDPSKLVVIAMTAEVFQEERDRILSAGCVEVIRKPYSIQELVSALSRHLGLRFIPAKDAAADPSGRAGAAKSRPA
jgi:signal transduction histidine kinase/CheY-like chemotaxis protein